MNTLEYALRLAEKGFRILPCAENQKRAALKNWQVEATTDPAKLREWFATGKRNLGVYAGERIVDNVVTHMVVIDLDVKGGKDGLSELARLAAPHGGMPPTYVVGTPKKGQHIYLCTTKPVGNSVGRLAPGIDVRGVNGYVVGPGSSILEGEYTVLANEQIADCPDWLEARLSHASTGTRSANREPNPRVDSARAESGPLLI